MNREIKFRAWDGESMRFVCRIDFDNENFDLQLRVPTESAPQNWKLSKIKDTPIMQYTGLLDKQGKEIYEGDICFLIPIDEYKSSTEMIGTRKVVWDINEARFYYDPYIPISWGGFESVEIIGNIYENPELL